MKVAEMSFLLLQIVIDLRYRYRKPCKLQTLDYFLPKIFPRTLKLTINSAKFCGNISILEDNEVQLSS